MQRALLIVLLITIVTFAQQHAVLSTYSAGSSCNDFSFESAVSVLSGNAGCSIGASHYVECDVTGGFIYYKMCGDDSTVASYELDTCTNAGAIDTRYTCEDSAADVGPSAVDYTVHRTGTGCDADLAMSAVLQRFYVNGVCVNEIDEETLTTSGDTTIVSCDGTGVSVGDCAGSPAAEDYTCNMGTFYNTQYECVAMGGPSDFPSGEPSDFPSDGPSDFPSDGPSDFPSGEPSDFPSGEPSDFPSGEPSDFPSGEPSDFPSGEPSDFPSGEPSDFPSGEPSDFPSGEPSDFPSGEPSGDETESADESADESTDESTSATFIIDSGNYLIASLVVLVVVAFIQ